MFKEFESGEKEIDIDTFQKLVLVTRGKCLIGISYLEIHYLYNSSRD